MPTIDIPDKICFHCGGTKWYQYPARNKLYYRCFYKRKDTNQIHKEKHRIKTGKEIAYKRRVDRKINNNYFIQQEKKVRDTLPDHYVKNILSRKHTGLKSKDIPQDLIELKRKQLTLTRKIKNNGKD
jgi:hypothetical protein